jgi:hypothetical protein
VKSVNLFFVIGLVLAVGGVALLVFGIVGYNDAQSSIGGIVEKIARGRSQAETTALMEMIGGGAAAVIGLVLLFARGRGKSR